MASRSVTLPSLVRLSARLVTTITESRQRVSRISAAHCRGVTRRFRNRTLDLPIVRHHSRHTDCTTIGSPAETFGVRELLAYISQFVDSIAQWIMAAGEINRVPARFPVQRLT